MSRPATAGGLQLLQPPALYLLGLVALVLAGPVEGVLGEELARLLAVIAFNVVLVFALEARLPLAPSFAGVIVATITGALVAAPALIVAGEGAIRLLPGAAALSVIAAVAWEEFLFRGLAFDFTRTRYGPWGAIALSSVVFAGAHTLDPVAATPLALAYLVAGGVLLGLVRTYYESVWPALALHAAHNLLLACVVDDSTSPASFLVALAAALAFGWQVHKRRKDAAGTRSQSAV